MASQWTEGVVFFSLFFGPIFVGACLIVCRLSILTLGPILEILFEAMGAPWAADIVREANDGIARRRVPQPPVQKKVQDDCNRRLDNVAHDIKALRQRDILLRTMILDTVVIGKVKDIETFDAIGPTDWKLKLVDSKQRLGTWEQYYSYLLRQQPLMSRMERDEKNVSVKPHRDAVQGDADAARSHGV
ncbi:hypothetical protein H109_01792 [Trichophyton interdigitale MR816]|uniref:Uncharacterized protein n=1 Tax=Trichophyton interdigitale (strain MR816) TaxID=1215338 RepID=A0A059JF29_TRIIM|nr:hypothetical protein H101_04216 [Trichophyton interdigitale H6]KDB26399.1 hypothetical protein H109_01792 [Trichophyton interdigitale MR816]